MACASEVSTRCGTARGSTTAQTQFTDRTVSQRGVWLHDRRSHRTTWPCTWWRRCPCHFRSTLPVSRAHRVAQGCTGYKVRVVRYKTRRGRAGHASAGTRRRQVALSLSAALAAAWGASAVVRYLVDRAWHRCQQAHAFAGPIEVLDHTTFGVDFESTCQSSWEGRSASRQRPRQWQRWPQQRRRRPQKAQRRTTGLGPLGQLHVRLMELGGVCWPRPKRCSGRLTPQSSPTGLLPVRLM